MKLDSHFAEIILDRLLDRANVANSTCPAGCCKCCGPVSFTKTEARRMGLDRMYTKVKEGTEDTCEFVGDDNRCKVYENRPFICRFFNTPFAGVFKCFETPNNGGMTPDEAGDLLDAYMEFIDLEGNVPEYIESMDHTQNIMKAREIRNGWGPTGFGIK